MARATPIAGAVLFAASLLALPGNGAAQPRPPSRPPAIAGGEHTDFSRLVLPVAAGTAWSLRAEDGSATLLLPGRDLRFDTSAALDRLSRGRVGAVTATRTGAGTEVTLTLSCACAVSATRIDGRLLALDIGLAEGPAIAPPKSRAVALAQRDAREASAVATAESALTRQLEHAAEQGVIDLPATAAPSTGTEAAHAIPPHAQVAATTVYDRDRPAEIPSPPGCLPDDRFDLAAWSRPGAGFAEQRAAAEARLLNEFDAANPEAVAELARLDIRFGLGREALGLLAAFPIAFPDRDLLADLARALEGETPPAEGPLLSAPPCPGAHGLWQRLAGRASDPAGTDMNDAFAALPADARLLLGPAQVTRLLGQGAVVEARRIRDLILRAGGAETPALAFAEAEILAAERRPSEAARIFRRVARGASPRETEAMIRHARIVLATGAPTPALATDLAIGAHLNRGLPARPELLALSAETLAQTGDPTGALTLLATARAAYPGQSGRFTGAATRLLAEAHLAGQPAPDNAVSGGGAEWAGLVLDHRGLLSVERAAVPARFAIARRLLEIGLPAEARDVVAPFLTGAGESEALLIAAEAELRLGHPDLARALVADPDSPAAAALLARAEAGSGAWADAVGTLADAGLEAETRPYAFPAGDWPRARGSDDPKERAMATYMAREVASPDAAPAETAFTAPLPRLDRPSLAAPRALLGTGPAIADFIRDLLSPDLPAAKD